VKAGWPQVRGDARSWLAQAQQLRGTLEGRARLLATSRSDAPELKAVELRLWQEWRTR